MGFGMIGLAGVLADDGRLGSLSSARAGTTPANPLNPLAPRSPQFPAKAKQVVHLFMNGGPSQVDTFDPKPLLDEVPRQAAAHAQPSHRTQDRRGPALAVQVPASTAQSGIEVSELFATHGRQHIDDMCVIRSMYADVPNHEPSLMLMNCGDGRLPRPSIGSWVTYGLGSENQNLPGFIAMCPGGYPIVGHAELAVRVPARAPTRAPTSTPSTPTFEKLIENIRNDADAAGRAAAAARPGAARSTSGTSRPAQHDAAARSAHPVVRAGLPHADPRRPTPSTSAASRSRSASLYGPGTHGRQLLITRRLLERGVRFVQVWSGGGPAVGQSRQPRSTAPQARRRLGPADRRVPRPT